MPLNLMRHIKVIKFHPRKYKGHQTSSYNYKNSYSKKSSVISRVEEMGGGVKKIAGGVQHFFGKKKTHDQGRVAIFHLEQTSRPGGGGAIFSMSNETHDRGRTIFHLDCKKLTTGGWGQFGFFSNLLIIHPPPYRCRLKFFGGVQFSKGVFTPLVYLYYIPAINHDWEGVVLTRGAPPDTQTAVETDTSAGRLAGRQAGRHTYIIYYNIIYIHKYTYII